MRKVLVGAAVAAVLIGAGVALGPAAVAQVRGRDIDPRREIRPGLERMLLQAPGAEAGVMVRELRAEESANAKLASGGVFVQDVREGGPAARAGLKSGDIIVEFDGERVRGVRHFRRLVQETPPSRAISAAIIRDGSRQTVTITLDAADDLTTVIPDLGREIERGLRALPRDFDFELPVPMRGRLGVSLTPLSDQLAAYFGVKQGALVSAVEPESPAARAGIRAGDVITGINGRAIEHAGDAMAAVRDAAPGSTLEIRLSREKKDVTVKATMPERERDRDRASRGRIRL